MIGSADAQYGSNRSLLTVIQNALLGGHAAARAPPLVPPRPPMLSSAPARAAAPTSAFLPVPMRAPAPPPNPPPSAQPWDPLKFFQVGQLVRYQGSTYKCTIPHQGQADWTPTAAVSLWQKVSG
jgi:hypothetical protein